MIFTLEALKARHGDALLLHYGSPDRPRLIVIDGGPAGTYAKALCPRLTALRERRTPDEPLPIRLLMVSHIDDDHINGVLALTSAMVERQEDGKAPLWQVETLWHNSFDDLLGNQSEVLFKAAKAEVGEAAFGDDVPDDLPVSRKTALVLANVPQGRNLRNDATRLAIESNQPFDDLVLRPQAGQATADLGDGLRFLVLGPSVQELRDLQEEWDKELKKKGLATPAEAAAYLDKSVPNLSSIVVLAEAGGRRMLLTGDARGDNILAGAEAAGLLEKGGSLHVDLLKLPHHGSDRDVAPDFFRRITADHYVVSGDGKYGNPELETLRMLSEARGNDRFTLHLTYPPEEFRPDYPMADLTALFAADRKAGKTYEVAFRPAAAESVVVDLGDEPLGER
jgi:hypothetical protein